MDNIYSFDVFKGNEISEKIAQMQIEAKSKEVAMSTMRLIVTGGYKSLVIGLRADK